MTRRSVRLRLTLWNVGVLALVCLIFLIAVHVAVRVSLLPEVDRRLARQAYLVTRDADDVPHSLARRVRRFDAAGHPQAWGREPADAPWDRAGLTAALAGRTTFHSVTEDGAPVRVLSMPTPHGALQIVASLSDLVALQTRLTWVLLVLAPGALLAAAAGGLFLTDRALRPVRAVADAAGALTVADLSQRLPVTGHDEFARLAETMNGMLARLETAFTQERRFIADASHELRTPLTAIKAHTSLALQGTRTPAQLREALDAVNHAADVMTRLVRDLLLLARADQGGLPLERDVVEVDVLCRHAVALSARADGPAIRVEMPDPPPVLSGDAHHLERLLVNLLDNARQHTPPEGHITLTARNDGATVMLTVADTGVGIPAAHLPHLGARFYRVDAARTRRQGGVGLGLAICHSIVDAHHGTLDIASQEGAGTTVTVRLPAGEGGGWVKG